MWYIHWKNCLPWTHRNSLLSDYRHRCFSVCCAFRQSSQPGKYVRGLREGRAAVGPSRDRFSPPPSDASIRNMFRRTHFPFASKKFIVSEQLQRIKKGAREIPGAGRHEFRTVPPPPTRTGNYGMLSADNELLHDGISRRNFVWCRRKIYYKT